METLLAIGLSNALAATVPALLAAGVGRVCRRPAVVHSLWLLVLLKLLIPSPLFVRPPWPAAESPAGTTAERPESAVSVAADLATTPGPAVEDDGPAADGPVVRATDEAAPDFPIAAPTASSSPTRATAAWPWKSVVAAVWLTGSGLWWLLVAVRVYRFRRLLRFAPAAPAAVAQRCRELSTRLGLSAAPGVWLVPGPLSPMLWALGRTPRLLLPAALWERLTEDQRDSLLLHELAHLRRRDHWVRRLELVVLGLYWWHPVAWWARHELQEAEEECCDAWVVWARPEAAPAYAAALVEALAFVSQTRAALPLPASGVGRGRRLKRRLTMILRDTPSRALTWGGFLAVLALAAMLLPLLPTWAEPAPAKLGDPPSTGSGGVASDSRTPARAEAQAPESPGGKVLEFRRSGLFAGTTQAVEQERLAAEQATRDARRAHDKRASAEQIQAAQDEVELLQVQLEIKRAQLGAAEADLRPAQERLNRMQKQAGAFPQESIEKARQEVVALEAQLLVKRAEVREPEVRLNQARRRLDDLKKLAAQPNQSEPARANQRGEIEQLREQKTRLEQLIAGYRTIVSATGGESPLVLSSLRALENDLRQIKARIKDVERVETKIRELEGKPALQSPNDSGPPAQPGVRRADSQRRLEDLEQKLERLMKEIESLRKEVRKPQSALPQPQQPLLPPNSDPLFGGNEGSYNVVPFVPGQPAKTLVWPQPENKFKDPRQTPTVPLMPPADAGPPSR